MHLGVPKHDFLVKYLNILINVCILLDEYIDQLTWNRYTTILEFLYILPI